MPELRTSTLRGNQSLKGATSIANQGEGKSTLIVILDDTIIAHVTLDKGNPFKYLQSLARSKHLNSLERQLLPYGYTLSDIGLGVHQRG